MTEPKYEHLKNTLSPILKGDKPQGPFTLMDGTGMSLLVLYLDIGEPKGTICVPYFHVDMHGFTRSIRAAGENSFFLNELTSPEDLLKKVTKPLPQAREQALSILSQYRTSKLHSASAEESIKVLEGLLEDKEEPYPREEIRKAAAALRSLTNLPYRLPLGHNISLYIQTTASSANFGVYLRNGKEKQSLFLGTLDARLSEAECGVELSKYEQVVPIVAAAWARDLEKEAGHDQEEGRTKLHRAERLFRAARDAKAIAYPPEGGTQ